jgi:hypothetical protein
VYVKTGFKTRFYISIPIPKFIISRRDAFGTSFIIHNTFL